MKWIQSILIIFLLLGVPFFEMDQIVDNGWLVCENSLGIKSEYKGPWTSRSLWYDFEPMSSLFNRVSFVSQLKNPLSVLYSSFQRTTPFSRPPPTLSFPLYL
jgi:hypothetical protein